MKIIPHLSRLVNFKINIRGRALLRRESPTGLLRPAGAGDPRRARRGRRRRPRAAVAPQRLRPEARGGRDGPGGVPDRALHRGPQHRRASGYEGAII